MASQEVLTALETLHRELEKLEPAIKQVETAQQMIQMAKTIPQMHLDLLTEVKETDTKYKGELKDLFSKELIDITEENKKLFKTTGEIQRQVKAEQEALSKLKDTIQSFYERVERINFPERLDKLDANIAGIMAAVLSIQGRVDLVERNITDRLKDIADFQKETRSILQNIFSSVIKKQQLNAYLTWGLIILGVLAVITFFKFL